MRNDAVYTLSQGTSPLLVSLPHVGTEIPQALRPRLTTQALRIADTDWHLDQLYAFVTAYGASLLIPRFSRYVIDLNRPPENVPMYPGVNNTELCPTHTFEGEPVYLSAGTPDKTEIAERLQWYWQPYHQALKNELLRLRALHGYALLWDGHSIKSTLPWLFEGVLPDLNLGTVSGTSCASDLRNSLAAVLTEQRQFTQVIDGRFKGGYITRQYGRPAEGFHAVQLEMSFSTYMSEIAPFSIDPVRSHRLKPVLERLINTLLSWKPHG